MWGGGNGQDYQITRMTGMGNVQCTLVVRWSGVPQAAWHSWTLRSTKVLGWEVGVGCGKLAKRKKSYKLC